MGRRSRSRSPGRNSSSKHRSPDQHRSSSGKNRDRDERRKRDDGKNRDRRGHDDDSRKEERRGGGGGDERRRHRERGGDDWGKRSEGHPAEALATGANRIQPGEPEKEEEKNAKVEMGLSGALMGDTNMFNGVVIKYSEPPEARKPKKRWRFYVFKGEESLPVMHLHRQSAYLIGKDRKVADIPVDHPSCSRQHAAFQYRAVEKQLGSRTVNRVVPYIIDLESSNGTYVNNQKIEPKRYVELKEQDVLKFGYSSREYVLLHENSQTADDEDGD